MYLFVLALSARAAPTEVHVVDVKGAQLQLPPDATAVPPVDDFTQVFTNDSCRWYVMAGNPVPGSRMDVGMLQQMAELHAKNTGVSDASYAVPGRFGGVPAALIEYTRPDGVRYQVATLFVGSRGMDVGVGCRSARATKRAFAHLDGTIVLPPDDGPDTVTLGSLGIDAPNLADATFMQQDFEGYPALTMMETDRSYYLGVTRVPKSVLPVESTSEADYVRGGFAATGAPVDHCEKSSLAAETAFIVHVAPNEQSGGMTSVLFVVPKDDHVFKFEASSTTHSYADIEAYARTKLQGASFR